MFQLIVGPKDQQNIDLAFHFRFKVVYLGPTAPMGYAILFIFNQCDPLGTHLPLGSH